MSGFNPMQAGGPLQPLGHEVAPPYQTTSGLAIASLICALFFCVPFLTPLLAIGMGIGALVAVSRSSGRKKGSGLAAAGLVIGSLVLLVHAAFAFGLFGIMLPLARSGAGQFKTLVQHVEQREYGEARAMLTPAAAKQADRQSLDELRALLTRQFGKIQSVDVDFTSRAYQLGAAPGSIAGSPFGFAARASGRGSYASASGAIPLPFKAVFDKQVVYGIIAFGVGPQAMASGATAQASLTGGVESITVVGPNGPWTFPFNASTAPAADDENSPADDAADEEKKGTNGGT